MMPLCLPDPQLPSLLHHEAASSPWPKLALCARTGQCLWINPAARQLLGDQLSLGADRSEVRAALTPCLPAADAADVDRLLGVTCRRPLQRLLLPATDAADGTEWTSLWLAAPGAEQLVLRARPVSAPLAAMLDNEGGNDVCVGLPASTWPTPAAQGVLTVNRLSGATRVDFADVGLARWLGCSPGQVLPPAAWLIAGLSAFDLALLLAAVGQCQPQHLLMGSALQLDGATDGAVWVLSVTPASDHEDPGQATALLRLQAVQARTPPGPRISRPLDTSREVLLHCDPQGRLSHLGAGWTRLTGRTVAACLGHALVDFCVPSAQAAVQALLAPVMQGQRQAARFELPFVHATQPAPRWLALRIWQDHGHGQACTGTLVDATERVLAQRIHGIQSTALENTTNGVVITDATQPGNPIVFVNRGFSRITGYSAEEVLGRNCAFLQGADRDQVARQQLHDAVQAEQAVTVVIRNYRRDGRPFWNQIELSPIREPLTGLVTHFFGLQTDVTLLREAEEAQARRTAELEQLFRSSPLGIVSVGADQRIRVLSPAFERVTGLRAAELLGQPLSCLQTQLQAKWVSGAAAQPLTSADPGRPFSPVPSPWAWPEPGRSVLWSQIGPPRRVLEALAAQLDENLGEQVLFVRDVTAEQDLQRMKTQFLASTAHELRAPLGSIRGFTELLLLRPHPPEATREMLQTVQRQAMRLNSLLSDLLDLSKLEAQGPGLLSLAPVPLAEVLQRALRVLLLPGDPRQVLCPAVADLPVVQAQAAKLEQVLINLLSNALKYSPGGQAVSVQAELDPPGHPGWVRLAVCDQGLGLAPEHLAQLFTRFFRADPQGPIPGTGLGLVIVKELVERMGGRIEVSSVLGQGSCFSVWLRQPTAESLPLRPAA